MLLIEKASLGLKAEINKIKINSKNTLDKAVGGIICLNFQAENKLERFTEKKFLLVTEITPSLIFKKEQVIIALLYYDEIAYKKKNYLGF